MTATAPDILEAARLPALCRGVCLYAGLPLPPATSAERFVVRSGAEPPELLVRLLEEGFVEDEVEVHTGTPGADSAGRARVTVESGYASPCPDVEGLHRALAGGGPLLLFAVERWNGAGELLGVTWAAVPEEEPPPKGRFRAAVRSYESGSPPAG